MYKSYNFSDYVQIKNKHNNYSEITVQNLPDTIPDNYPRKKRILPNTHNQPTVDFKPKPELNAVQQNCVKLMQSPSMCFTSQKADGGHDLIGQLEVAVKDVLGRTSGEDRMAFLRDLWPVFAPMINNAIMGNSK